MSTQFNFNIFHIKQEKRERKRKKRIKAAKIDEETKIAHGIKIQMKIFINRKR